MSATSEILQLILITAIVLGGAVAAGLALHTTGNRLANRMLMAFVLVSLIPPANVYSQLAFGTIDWCMVLATNLTWLYGPLLLGFVRALHHRAFSARAWLWHLTPFTFVLIWRLIFEIDHPGWIASALFAQMLAYLVATVVDLIKHRTAIVGNAQSYKTSFYYWLWYLVGGLAVLMAVDTWLISRFVWFTPIDYTLWQYVVALSALYIQGIAFFAIFRPQVVFNQWRAERKVSSQSATPSANDEPGRLLTAELAEQLSHALDTYLQKQKPHLDNDLSMPKLADDLGLGVHQLSELLNRHRGESYSQLINRLRVEESQRLLTSEPDTPVVEIAFAAGFNNKSTFYRLFREATGVTPHQYRKQHRAAVAV